MPASEPTETTNLDISGHDALPWSRARDHLVAETSQTSTSFFLATTRPGGQPHVAAVGVTWHDGDLYFQTGPGTRKAKNLAANRAAVISVGLEGSDLVLEGEATKVDDLATMRAVVAGFNESGWPVEIEDGRLTAPYSAPTAGPPPWDLYRFRFHTGFGVATVPPDGGTRWRFR
jgi:nitroimidazol reductase NimA-like FMN-containing flavoprotein (pyridoxamine 5'-phosphate oxidase superfamily)